MRVLTRTLWWLERDGETMGRATIHLPLNPSISVSLFGCWDSHSAYRLHIERHPSLLRARLSFSAYTLEVAILLASKCSHIEVRSFWDELQNDSTDQQVAKRCRDVDDIRVEKKFSKIGSNRVSGRCIGRPDVHHQNTTFSHKFSNLEEVVIFCLSTLDVKRLLIFHLVG